MQRLSAKESDLPRSSYRLIGLWSESTLFEERRMDWMTSEIQRGLCRTPWQASVTTLLFCLSSGHCYSLSLCRHCLCCEWFDSFSICRVFAKKGNSVHTLGVTNSLSGRAPNSWSHQVSSSFWLIILHKKTVFHQAEAVKIQVVFSLLGFCWVVCDTSWKTRLLMHIFPGALYLAFNIYVVSPWEKYVSLHEEEVPVNVGGWREMAGIGWK